MKCPFSSFKHFPKTPLNASIYTSTHLKSLRPSLCFFALLYHPLCDSYTEPYVFFKILSKLINSSAVHPPLLFQLKKDSMTHFRHFSTDATHYLSIKVVAVLNTFTHLRLISSLLSPNCNFYLIFPPHTLWVLSPNPN